MTLIEEIQQRLEQLPPERQSQVLDFVAFLQSRLAQRGRPDRPRSLRNHPAFGSWKPRQIDALAYQQSLRDEWDHRP